MSKHGISESTGPYPLSRNPAHLGRGASISVQPEFTGEPAWYEAYGERTGADGVEGRLVSMHTFGSDWDMWEMHPEGSEMVVVTAGRLTLIQEQPEGERRIELAAGQYAINPPGVWHTASATAPVTALFITSGIGTQHRPR